jgi:hypothetical protein
MNLLQRKQEIVLFLLQKEAYLHYTTVAGETRVVLATLMFERVNEFGILPKTDSVPDENENVLKYVDVSQKAWRSCRVENIMLVEGLTFND